MEKSRAQPLIAWAVHAYTALGAVAAFAMTTAVFAGRYQTAFLLMVAATAIDGTDGLFTRWARVKELTPSFDGARLDDIVDYLTFVFVPALLLYRAGTLPPQWAGLIVCVVLLSSAYGFSSLDAKTDDYFFTGFPSYWNIVALYMYVARLPQPVNAAVLLVLSALIFVRIGYVYPSRTPVLRGLTLALCAVWAAMLLLMILMLPDVPGVLLAASLLFPIYYVALSMVLNARRVRR